MPREFQGQAELHDYAERNCLEYAWEYTPAFAKRQRLLSPEQYEIVEVRTSRGVSRVMLFSKAIIQAEWEANAPLINISLAYSGRRHCYPEPDQPPRKA